MAVFSGVNLGATTLAASLCVRTDTQLLLALAIAPPLAHFCPDEVATYSGISLIRSVHHLKKRISTLPLC